MSEMSEQKRLAYADPPYIGQARRHYQMPEVDHEALIKKLILYDGWALSASSTSLKEILAYCPPEIRIAAWVKPFAFFHRGTRGHPPFAWEPVIFVSARPQQRTPKGIRDWLSANAFGVTPAERTWGKERKTGGIKPPAFCQWLFCLLGAKPNDSFDDLFPGSRMVSEQWKRWLSQQEQEDE